MVGQYEYRHLRHWYCVIFLSGRCWMRVWITPRHTVGVKNIANWNLKFVYGIKKCFDNCTSETYYPVQLGLQDKGRAIKGLVDS